MAGWKVRWKSIGGRRRVLLAFVVMLALNFGFAAVASAGPERQEWLYYVDLSLPASATANLTPEHLSALLDGLGYTTEARLNEFGVLLSVEFPGDPDFRAMFHGLGDPEGAWVGLQVRCWVSYARQQCPDDMEAQMRAHLGRVLQDAGLPGDPAEAVFGDEDFATLPEFVTFVVQGAIVLVAATWLVMEVLGAPLGGRTAGR